MPPEKGFSIFQFSQLNLNYEYQFSRVKSLIFLSSCWQEPAILERRSFTRSKWKGENLNLCAHTKPRAVSTRGLDLSLHLLQVNNQKLSSKFKPCLENAIMFINFLQIQEHIFMYFLSWLLKKLLSYSIWDSFQWRTIRLDGETFYKLHYSDDIHKRAHSVRHRLWQSFSSSNLNYRWKFHSSFELIKLKSLAQPFSFGN